MYIQLGPDSVLVGSQCGFGSVLAVLVGSSFTSFTAGALRNLLTPRPRQSGVLLTPRSPLDLRPWSVMDTRRNLATHIASLKCFCGRLVASKQGTENLLGHGPHLKGVENRPRAFGNVHLDLVESWTLPLPQNKWTQPNVQQKAHDPTKCRNISK